MSNALKLPNFLGGGQITGDTGLDGNPIKSMFAKRTPPEAIEEDNLAHLPQFEALRGKVNDVKGQINDLKIRRVQFETDVDEQRQQFDDYITGQRKDYDEQLRMLELKLGTLDTHAQDYIKSVWPEKKLVDDPDCDVTAPDLPTHTPIESITGS